MFETARYFFDFSYNPKDITQDIPAITIKDYILGFFKGVLVAIMALIPFALVSLILPPLALIIIPTWLMMPFAYPFAEKRIKEKKLKKAREEALLKNSLGV